MALLVHVTPIDKAFAASFQSEWDLMSNGDPTYDFDFIDTAELYGLAELVPVDDQALENPFAAELGIEPDGSMWRLTARGRELYDGKASSFAADLSDEALDDISKTEGWAAGVEFVLRQLCKMTGANSKLSVLTGKGDTLGDDVDAALLQIIRGKAQATGMNEEQPQGSPIAYTERKALQRLQNGVSGVEWMWSHEVSVNRAKLDTAITRDDVALYLHPPIPEGHVVVPVKPTDALLYSMAVRYDHGLGVPGYYDQDIFGIKGVSHERRLESAIGTMRQLHEEVVGTGFYRIAL